MKWLILFCIANSGLLYLKASPDVQQYPTKAQSILYQKANLFKYRVEYDSSLYYFQNLGDLLALENDSNLIIKNDIDIANIYILQRDFSSALTTLGSIEKMLSNKKYPEPDIKADYLQVMGSYLTANGEIDSAKHCFYQSINVRKESNSKSDTLLHYAYNKLGNLYLAKSDFDSAYICHQIALDLALKKKNPVNYLSASSYQNLGIAAHLLGDFKMAERCYTKSLALKEELFDKNDPALAKIYGNLGKFFTDRSKYNIALEYYDKSEQLLASRYDRNNLLFAHLYWNKGNVYTHKGDYAKASSYLTKALSIFEKNLNPKDPDIFKILTDLGFVYDRKGDTLLAIDYYNKAAKNRENAGIIKIYRNLGNLYQLLQLPDSAEKYYQLSIHYARKFYSGYSYDLALCYQYYGEYLAKSNKEDNSLEYFILAEDIFKNIFGTKNKDLSTVFLLQGEYYSYKKEFKLALIKIQQSLIALLPDFSESDPSVNPSLDEVILDYYLLDALRTKAIVLQDKFKQSQDLEDLERSLEVIDLTVTVTEEMRKTYNEEESQLILNKFSRSIFDLGIRVSTELYSQTTDLKYVKKAFQYSEKGQAVILLSALRGLEAQTNTNIPAEMEEKENNITTELANYNNLLYQEKQNKYPDEAKIQRWSDDIFNLKLSHDSLLAKFQSLYPEYFRLKFDYSVVSADSAIKHLGRDQAIIEYYMADSAVIGFILTDKKLSVDSLGNRQQLICKLDSLHGNFTGKDFFNPSVSDFHELTRLSSELYDILIRPFEQEIDGKRLIIIPDGKLGYLSFDLLLKSGTNDSVMEFSKLPWLIKSNPINYSSSATIFFEQNKLLLAKENDNILAFAPSYSFTSNERGGTYSDSVLLNLNPLTGTKEEINSISGYFRTKKLFGEDATETYFKKHAGHYGILHLAMHTIIDDNFPLYSKLVFTLPQSSSQDDGYLNTYELFDLHLPGQLAVLSACNTGSGKLERSEGIISLARGFFYAGIPSVVMTLWEIEDHSSADLISIFYKKLEESYPKDVALQQAKIAYLEKAGQLQSHPYFWAGYVCIGNTDPIKKEPFNSLPYLIILGSLLLVSSLLLYFFINKRVFFRKKGL